jgi:hypothetical protein
VRRLLAVIVASVALMVSPAHAFAQDDGDTGETIVTLANDKSLAECFSAVPKPGCTTSDGADAMQLTLLGVLVAGLAFLGWKIARGIRHNNPPQQDPVGSDGPEANAKDPGPLVHGPGSRDRPSAES